jgi:hypothetical protein
VWVCTPQVLFCCWVHFCCQKKQAAHRAMNSLHVASFKTSNLVGQFFLYNRTFNPAFDT